MDKQQNEYTPKNQSKSATTKNNARRQVESMEYHQKLCYKESSLNQKKNTNNVSTYQVASSDRSSAQEAASKMMEDYRHTMRPAQGSYPDNF